MLKLCLISCFLLSEKTIHGEEPSFLEFILGFLCGYSIILQSPGLKQSGQDLLNVVKRNNMRLNRCRPWYIGNIWVKYKVTGVIQHLKESENPLSLYKLATFITLQNVREDVDVVSSVQSLELPDSICSDLISRYLAKVHYDETEDDDGFVLHL